MQIVTSEEFIVRLLLNGYRGLIRPVLFTSSKGDPEVIHDQIVALLGKMPDSWLGWVDSLLGVRAHPIDVAGVSFPGRVGLAAGMDENGVGARAWSALGFGFAELGTVTAHAQPGNPKPRLFRLQNSRALINRMGFNNAGVEALAAHLEQLGVKRGNNALNMPVGVSIGKTKTTPLADATDDYLFSLRTIHEYADYVAINVSSPNTPHLRELQHRDSLTALLTSLVDEAHSLSPGNPIPVFLKVSPDVSTRDLDTIVRVSEDSGASAIIATNTTTTRHMVHPSDHDVATQVGGLSGAPLTRKALRIVETIASQTTLHVIGCGGIMTPADAQAFFDAGASLIQLYTGFIYRGPALVRGVNMLTYPDRVAV